jgi:hypothetical protein
MKEQPIIIVIYLPTNKGNYSFSTRDTIETIKKELNKNFEGDNVKWLVVPSSKLEDIRIECINPVLVTKDQYNKAAKAVDTIKEVAELISQGYTP